MTIRRHANNAATTLDGGINASVTTISVTDASVFPSLTGSDEFRVTIGSLGTVEIVTVTSVSVNDLTVTRGSEGTTPLIFATGLAVILNETADSYDRKLDKDGAILSTATVAVGDKVLIQDLSDSDKIKTVTTQAIADLSVTASSVDTLINKTIDANGTGNSITNIDVSDLANGTDGELITWDASAAPTTVAAGTTRQVLTSNGAGAAPTFQQAGRVLQVVQATRTSTESISIVTNGTFVDSAFTATITPSSTSSKIMILATFYVGTDNVTTFNASCKMKRGATSINIGDAASNRYRTTGTISINTTAGMQTMAITYLDSPASSSATTYTPSFTSANTTSTVYLNRSSSDTDTAQFPRGASTIILIEIDGT